MTQFTEGARWRRAVAALAATVLFAACGGDPGSLTPVVAASAAIGGLQTGAPNAQADDAASTVEAVLGSSRHPALKWSAISDVVESLKPLYEAESDRLLWFAGSTPAPMVPSMLATVASAADHGLDPADYDAALLADRWNDLKAGTRTGPERARFDLALSVAVARMLDAVRRGRVDPATMNWGYENAAKHFDVSTAIREIGPSRTLAAVLDSLEPKFPHYARARRALAAYRRLARAGEPGPVPDLPKGSRSVKPGARWPDVGHLADRLYALGDLPERPTSPVSIYAGSVVDAVRRFQQRHGLEADGAVGTGTIKALNVPMAQRVRQIELAMERMRWLPMLSDRPNVFVNVALFRLWATDPVTGAEPLRMNVVVGKSLDHRTPLFIEEMEYVVFRPYWYPPPSITTGEIVPHVQRDASYFDREALEIVESGDDDAAALSPTPANLAAVVAGKLFIRQRPGPANSLGLAKFIFPNDENIYMHGTPARQLFSRTRRDFSHGCIRLEDPARFAQWVLRDQPEWTRARIDAAMQAKRPTRVDLKETLTVVLFYDTVHVNSENVVHFVDDIYGHDRELDAALVRGYPYPGHGR